MKSSRCRVSIAYSHIPDHQSICRLRIGRGAKVLQINDPSIRDFNFFLEIFFSSPLESTSRSLSDLYFIPVFCSLEKINRVMIGKVILVVGEVCNETKRGVCLIQGRRALMYSSSTVIHVIIAHSLIVIGVRKPLSHVPRRY